MFQPELLTWAFKFLLPPLWVLAWFMNLDNIKSTILFILTLCFGLIRAYFWVHRAWHNKRMRELEREEKEQNAKSLKKFRDLENDEYRQQP